MDFRGVARLPLAAFPVGALSARRFRRLRRFFASLQAWLRLIGELTAAPEGAPVEWAAVERDTERLAAVTVRLAHLFQDLEPSRWLDLGEWALKLAFYARLAAGHPEPRTEAHFFALLPAGHGLEVTRHLWRYVLDVADLQPQLDRAACRLDASEAAGWRQLAALLETMPLPPALEREGEIRAFELGGRHLLLCPVLMAPEAELPLEPVLVPVRDFWAGVRRAWAGRYAPKAVAWRRLLGRCDEEVDCRVVVVPDPVAWSLDGAVTLVTEAPMNQPPAEGLAVCRDGAWIPVAARAVMPEGQPWRQRLGALVERLVGEGAVPARPDACRCVEDLVLLALGGWWEAVFRRLGGPGLGVEGVKTLPLPPLGVVRLYCAGEALFPSAAGRPSIGSEDIRCLPLWAVLAGWQRLASPAPFDSAALVGHGIVRADAMHLCLTLGRQVVFVEGESLTEAGRTVRIRWKASRQAAQDLVWAAGVLGEWGVAVRRRGLVLDASMEGGTEVALQRALAVLGGVLRGVLGPGPAPGWWREPLAAWGRAGERMPR